MRGGGRVSKLCRRLLSAGFDFIVGNPLWHDQTGLDYAKVISYASHSFKTFVFSSLGRLPRGDSLARLPRGDSLGRLPRG